MADYLKIARTALKGAPKWAGAGAESTTPVESPEIEARPEPAEAPPTQTLEEQEHANTILGRAGVRLMALEGGVTIGIWSDLDSAELREALRVFHADGVPPILYLDGAGIPDKYKERRVAGEPVPLDVVHAMEENPWTPWETRDRMLSEMGWSPDGIPWAEWKAAALNRLFLEQGVTGKRGRITAATIRHGEQAAHLAEKARNAMASKSAKNGFAFEAGNRECGVSEHPMSNPHWFEKANLEGALPGLNPPLERTAARGGGAPLGHDSIGTESGGKF